MKDIVAVVAEKDGLRVVEQVQSFKTKTSPDPAKKGKVIKVKIPVGKKYAVEKTDNMNREYDLTKAVGRLFARNQEKLVEAGVQTYTPLYFTNNREEAISKMNKIASKGA